MEKQLHCVVCCYDVSPDVIVPALEAIGVETDTRVFGVVVNNGVHSNWSPRSRWEVMQGSNTLMDFSAFAEGAARILPSVRQGDAVLFINDSTFTKHNATRHLRELVKYVKRLQQIDVPCIVGKVDNYTDHCYVNPWSGLDAYVATFAFMLNAGGVRGLLDVYETVDSAMGDICLDLSDYRWGAGLSKAFREFLRTHILMPNSPSAWYQAGKHQGNAEVLQIKSRCVYLEHRLSGEIGKTGVIVSLYPRQRDKLRFWLADQLAKLKR